MVVIKAMYIVDSEACTQHGDPLLLGNSVTDKLDLCTLAHGRHATSTHTSKQTWIGALFNVKSFSKSPEKGHY